MFLGRQAGLLPFRVSEGIPPIDPDHRRVDVDLAPAPFPAFFRGEVKVFPVVGRVACLGFRLLRMVEGGLSAILRENIEGLQETRIIADRNLTGGDGEIRHFFPHTVRRVVFPSLDFDPAGLRCSRGKALLILREKENSGDDGHEKHGNHPHEHALFLRPYRGGRRRDDLGRRSELLLDLFAKIADLRPFQRLCNAIATHPREKGQATGRAGMVLIEDGFHHIAELQRIAHRMIRKPVTGDDEVLQADDIVVVHVDRVQPQRQGGAAMGFVVNVRLRDATQDMDEALRPDPFAAFRTIRQRLTGKQLVSIVAEPVFHRGLVDGADQRMLHPGFRADIRDELLTFHSPLQFLDEHHATHRNLPSQPCPRRFGFPKALLREIIAESVFLFAHFFHTRIFLWVFHSSGRELRSGISGSKFGGRMS